MTQSTSACTILLLALSAGGLQAKLAPLPLRVDFRGSYPLAAHGSVAIHNLYGDVRITAWDRDEVQVTATKHPTGGGRAEDARIVVDTTPGGVSIHTLYTGADSGQAASVEYRIMVPRSAHLDNVKLVNGELSLSGMTGPVRASSVNGGIHAEAMEGEVDLSTVNGRLQAGFQRLRKSNSISLSSVNGPITVSLPTGAGASVSALNRSGGIDADFGRSWKDSTGHRLEADVNGGGAPVRLHNVNGGISIHSTWERRHTRPTS
jgi:DUF4097 and DUF4098 domain-containing protein YvlB